MSQSSRRALFYAFFLVFLILGTGIVLFAQGWRMDLPGFRISKVGGIYVRSFPEDANIFLNGKPIKNQSGFLSRGTLISDLFPKTYRLALTAPGYDDWNENASVAPSLVVNHKYAVLVPANATSTAMGTIENFAVSHQNAILETTGGEIMANGKTIGFGHLVAESPDLQSVIFQTAKGTYEFSDVSVGTAQNLSNVLTAEGFSATVPGLFLTPLTNTMVLAANSAKVDLLDMSQLSGTKIGAATRGQTIVPAFALSPSAIAWALNAGQANSSSLIFDDLSSGIIASTTVTLGAPVKKLAWVSGGLLGILAKNGSLYLYDVNQQALEKTADDVRDFYATPDGSRIATLESQSFEIFTFGNPEGYYRFNIPDAGNALSALWYRDDDHLFINYPDHVSFLDLEDAGLMNFTTVALGTSPRYDADANALYIINPQSTLVRFDFPK